MDISYLLIILLVGAIATFFAGDKLASKVALFFGLASFAISLVLLNQFNQGENINDCLKELPLQSYIRAHKIFTINSSLIISKLTNINSEFKNKVVEKK